MRFFANVNRNYLWHDACEHWSWWFLHRGWVAVYMGTVVAVDPAPAVGAASQGHGEESAEHPVCASSRYFQHKPS